MKTPKFAFKAIARPCDCISLKRDGYCLLPVHLSLIDPESGGWWIGRGHSFLEALEQALERSGWKDYKPTP